MTMRSLQLLSNRSIASRIVCRTAKVQAKPRQLSRITRPQIQYVPLACQTIRTFSSAIPRRIALAGEKEEVPESLQTTSSKTEPAKIADAEYHELADQYLNSLQLSLEDVVDNEAQKGLEVEFSAGVMTILHPKKGTYVINKQPPNKQIWLSSPVSGPKRYDWVIVAPDGAHDSMNAKQDTEGTTGTLGDDGALGGGRWTYIRDGSTLTGLLKDELEVTVALSEEGDATPGREGPGASGAGGGVGAAGGVEG